MEGHLKLGRQFLKSVRINRPGKNDIYSRFLLIKIMLQNVNSVFILYCKFCSEWKWGLGELIWLWKKIGELCWEGVARLTLLHQPLSPQICNLTFYLKEPGAVYIFVPVYSDLTLWIIVRVRMSWGLTYLEWKRIYFKLFLSFQNHGDQILKSFSTLENSGLYFPLSPSHLRTKTKTFIIPKKIDFKK